MREQERDERESESQREQERDERKREREQHSETEEERESEHHRLFVFFGGEQAAQLPTATRCHTTNGEFGIFPMCF